MSIEERWIPTTTCKWPHRNGDYILTLKDGSVKFAFFERYPYPGDDYLKPRWYELEVPSDGFVFYDIYIPEDDVVAWMPKPQAYKKGTN